MRTSVALLSGYLATFAAAVGIEGSFIALGTVSLAVAASFISPAAPWAVIGIVALALGLVLARSTG